jgi:hypothetical protein
MKKTKNLAKCNFVTSFDLWLSKGMHDVFSFIIKFENYLQLKHVIICLFERIETIKQSLEINPIEWLDQYGLKEKKKLCERQRVKFECIKIYCEL